MDFRLDASMAKYLTVEVARAVGTWAADLFGAVSVIFEHPVHKFPMDAWLPPWGRDPGRAEAHHLQGSDAKIRP